MGDTCWLTMLAHQQTLNRLARRLLHPAHRQTLTASELELLSRLYLDPEDCTPLALSRQSGMKKEAVSRCLKQLFEKGCLSRQRSTEDERSYRLSLTETGLARLEENYGPILQPLYELKRRMGPDFESLFRLLEQADAAMETTQEKKENE